MHDNDVLLKVFENEDLPIVRIVFQNLGRGRHPPPVLNSWLQGIICIRHADCKPI